MNNVPKVQVRKLMALFTEEYFQHLSEEAQALYWVRDVQGVGIQEKYLKSQLSAYEPLTELDVKRFVLHTKMQQIIHVKTLSEQDLSAVIAHEQEKNIHETAPYSMSMMLDIADHHEEATPQWISLVITVDPVAAKINYKINSEVVLNESQLACITNELKSKFQGFSLKEVIKLVSVDENKFSGGYQVLHALYTDEHITPSEEAKGFVTTEANYHALCSAVYKAQLEAIFIPPELNDSLNEYVASHFDNGRIKQSELQQFLYLLKTPAAEATVQNPIVSEKIAELLLHQTKVYFPGQKLDSELSSADYQAYLLLVHEKFKNTDPNKTLDELVITGESAALMGLNAYNETRLPLPFKSLTLDLSTLDLSADPARATYLFYLKSTLLTLSENNLISLKLEDPTQQLDADAIRQIADFVQRHHIAIDVSLPEAYRTSPEQKRIDESVSDYVLERSIRAFNKIILPKQSEKSANKPRRKREQLTAQKNLAIDVELQQEQQIEASVETSASVETKQDGSLTNEETVIYTLQTFQQKMKEGSFDKDTKSFLLDSSDENCERLWKNWLGLLTQQEALNPFTTTLSKAAVEELMRYQEQFQYGLDWQNLPPGFVLIRYNFSSKSYFDFNAQLKSIATYNPLQVQTGDSPKERAMTHSQFTELVENIQEHPVKSAWDRINEQEYNRQVHAVFKQLVPQMLLLDEVQLNQLFSICFQEEHFDADKLQFLLENAAKIKAILATNPVFDAGSENPIAQLNDEEKEFIKNYHEKQSDFAQHLLHKLVAKDPDTREKINDLISKIPDLNLNGLLQVYTQSGAPGIEALTQVANKNPELFKQLNTLIFAKNNSYSPLLDESLQEAMSIIESFIGTDKVWWDALLTQHCQAQSNVNLIDMVNAFKEFKIQIRQLGILSDGMSFSFPEQCNLTGVKSLPVALSRILSLMKHVPQASRQAQWHEIGALDFSSNGVNKAISDKSGRPWNFVTAEMQLTADHELQLDKPVQYLNRYIAPKTGKDLLDDDLNKVVERFFRCVGCQEEKSQLPLEFYRYVYQSIQEASSLSREVKINLYMLLASATTDERNVKIIASLDEAKKDFDQLLNLIIETPLPGITPNAIKNKMRLAVLSSLAEMVNAPPLPTLNRLIFLISNSLNSLNNIRKNSPRLAAANAALSSYVEEKGSSIYEGLNNYSKTDYENSELFFDYLNVVDYIKNNFDEINIAGIVRLISTFKLKPDELNDLKANFFTPELSVGHVKRQRQDALYILSNIIYAENTIPLTTKDLTWILQVVINAPLDRDSPADALKNILMDLTLKNGQKLSTYFSQAFLDNYGFPKVSEELHKQLVDEFGEEPSAQIEKMLKQFKDKADANYYDSIVDKIIRICKPLGQLEKNIFIAKLTSAAGLYTDIRPLNEEDNPFLNLLEYISANGTKNDFLNLLTAERNLVKSSTTEQRAEFFVQSKEGKFAIANLDQKALLYMQSLLPQIRSLKEPAISLVEMTPRMLEMLLKTPNNQLIDQSKVILDGVTDFALPQAQLNSILEIYNAPHEITEENQAEFYMNLEALSSSIEQFMQISKLEDKEFLAQYKIKLEAINQPKMAPEAFKELQDNNQVQLLIRYVTGAMQPDERMVFETLHGKEFLEIYDKYPGIDVNKPLINKLFANPQFFNDLAQGTALEAAKNNQFLDDKLLREAFLEALEKDVQAFASFKIQTQNIQKELSKNEADFRSYPKVFAALYEKINKLVTENPNSKKPFLELFDRYLQNYLPSTHGELLDYLNSFIEVLDKTFAKTTDKNIVFSLCLQFNGENDPQHTPESLLLLLKAVQGVPEEHQVLLLKTAVALINNDKDFVLADFEKLCILATYSSGQSAFLISTLGQAFSKAPFPTIEQMMAWHQEALNSEDYNTKIKEITTEFSKHPCVREPKNGFHVDKALVQLAKFKVNGSVPTDKELKAGEAYFHKFYDLTIKMRDLTVEELLVTLRGFELQQEPIDYDTLIAVAAELLHRSKGQEGNSLEINTTQYMALLTMMKMPGHVTSKIGTGEGKTRIMMIALASQYALGKTVDFVTSDVQLATRDYVEFQSYFDLIGAKTSMILASSDPSFYQQRGINFSDPANLSLFRNKARSLGLGDKVIATDPKQRSLMLDEADKTYFDVADTRFNFSKEGDELIRGMQWVYPLLVEYFAQKEVRHKTSPMTLYFEDVDASRESFLQFANSLCTKEQWSRLKSLSNAQIEQWQVSAVTAAQLKFKEDFQIEPDILIDTPEGPKISSEAQLLLGNRISKTSKRSFGVHQCLHARLNLIREHLVQESNPDLKAALQKCEHGFYIQEEKQIVYSSTSKNLADDYKEGELKAVTGTEGSLLEKEEAAELYGHTQNKMQFVEVPRDQGLRRQERAIRLTRNQKQQIQVLIEQINEARRKNQPILIIAEDEAESKFLFEELETVFKQNIQHVHSQLSHKKEKELVAQAGMAGMITVSTDMIGRGTDIALSDDAKKYGLNVMITYLPRPRDLEQIIGRSGRFGAEGESSLVLDKIRLKKQLGKKALGSNFYRNAEVYIEREQALMDRRKQCERLIKNIVGDFRKILTDNYYSDMISNVRKEDFKTLTPPWSAFFDKSDKAWNELWPQIQKELTATEIYMDKIDALLAEYKSNVQEAWDTLRRQVKEADVSCLPESGAAVKQQKAIDKLQEQVPDLVLSATARKLISSFDLQQYSFGIYKVYDQFDSRAHAGRVVVHENWYTPVVASIKGYINFFFRTKLSDARPPFANFRAWLNGTGQLFPDLRAAFASLFDALKNLFSKEKSKPVVNEEKEEFNGSYATLLKTGVATSENMAKKENVSFDEEQSLKQDEEPMKDEEQSLKQDEEPMKDEEQSLKQGEEPLKDEEQLPKQKIEDPDQYTHSL
jgi:hypothetical protein